MLASTKHGAVIKLVAFRIALRRPFQRERLLRAPRPVCRIVLVAVAQLPAQHLADVARQAHVALGRMHSHARGGLLVERNCHVLQACLAVITRISCILQQSRRRSWRKWLWPPDKGAVSRRRTGVTCDFPARPGDA